MKCPTNFTCTLTQHIRGISYEKKRAWLVYEQLLTPVLFGDINMMPEWLSFWNEFILSPYSSLLIVYTISNQYKSFRFSFRMKFSSWYEISFWYHENWKWTSFRIENRKLFSLGRVAHTYLIWRENHASENALGVTVRYYQVNAVRTSL